MHVISRARSLGNRAQSQYELPTHVGSVPSTDTSILYVLADTGRTPATSGVPPDTAPRLSKGPFVFPAVTIPFLSTLCPETPGGPGSGSCIKSPPRVLAMVLGRFRTATVAYPSNFRAQSCRVRPCRRRDTESPTYRIWWIPCLRDCCCTWSSCARMSGGKRPAWSASC